MDGPRIIESEATGGRSAIYERIPGKIREENERTAGNLDWPARLRVYIGP
jgi:hypothetical protein